jgi:two-component system, OmpR family, response regulator
MAVVRARLAVTDPLPLKRLRPVSGPCVFEHERNPRMLVLSRRPNERIVFPGINTTVRVVNVKPGVVRLGIEAPPEVTVLRQEVADRLAEWAPKDAGCPGAKKAARPRGSSDKRLDQRLQAASVGVGLARLQMRTGDLENAERTLTTLQKSLGLWRRAFKGEAESKPPQPATTYQKTPKVLIVEDDQNERELLASFLRMAGLDVETAADGLDALDRLHTRGRPDMMLLDMVLPRCDGPATLREIRRDPACAPRKIFAVSGHAPDQFCLDDQAPRVDRWFRKPIDIKALLQDLSSELQLSSC